MSNDHDDVTGDGHEAARSASGEPDDSTPTGAAGPASAAADSGPAPDPADPDTGSDEDAAAGAAGAAASGSGRVAAGSARAAARRSAARAATTESKGAATPGRSATATERPNIFGRIARFLREVVSELRKVIWPTRNQMVTYTIVVIIFVSFMVALVAGLDVLFARAVLAIFG